MDYISVREAAQKWEISERHVQKLCEESRIETFILIQRVLVSNHVV
mgnify:CR=1 FL=1